MAIEFNTSEKEVIAVKKLYTGITNMLIVAVNPSMEEANALGIKLQQEPIYVTEQDGTTSARLEFYLRNPEKNINTKIVYWLKDKNRVSKSGKTQFINKYGKTAWAVDAEALGANEYFVNEGVRKAYDGEEGLVDTFIRNWVNAEYNTAAKKYSTILPDTAKFFKGDFSELKNILKAIPHNGVRVLLGVKDGKYQDVYTRHIERTYQKSNNAFIKALNDEYGQFKSEFNADLELTEYTGTIVTPEKDVIGGVDPITAIFG